MTNEDIENILKTTTFIAGSPKAGSPMIFGISYIEYYNFMINNARAYIEKSNPDDNYNAFDISSVLSICLAKRKEDILNDLIGD